MDDSNISSEASDEWPLPASMSGLIPSSPLDFPSSSSSAAPTLSHSSSTETLKPLSRSGPRKNPSKFDPDPLLLADLGVSRDPGNIDGLGDNLSAWLDRTLEAYRQLVKESHDLTLHRQSKWQDLSNQELGSLTTKNLVKRLYKEVGYLKERIVQLHTRRRSLKDEIQRIEAHQHFKLIQVS